MVEIGIHSLQWSPQADYRHKVGLNLPGVVPHSGTTIVTAGTWLRLEFILCNGLRKLTMET
eukprot:scaffold151799_cov58-Cyclotella_meneghiniana.AAC.2